MKTVLVVEDVRDSLLEIDPGLEIVGVQTAMEALELLGSRKSDNQKTFDGIFLDIELPGMSGIQMLERLPKPLPPTVLVTAHAMMALDAFGLGVIGCLLKPVDQQRLRRAYAQMKAISDAPKPSSEVSDLERGSESRVLLRDRNGIHMVHVQDFTHLTEELGSTRIHFGDHSVVIPHRLGDMETGLDRDYFFRVNAETIVNLDKVTHYTTSPTGLFVAGLPDGTAAEFSPDRSRIFQERYEL
jgi:two-component system LytT family response regulator